MVNLIRMEFYRMWKAKGFKVCLILALVLAAAQTPLVKALAGLSKELTPEAPMAFPETEKISEFLYNPLGLLGTVLMLISAVIFFHADMEGGYIKNIAGQMPQRGYSMVSRFLACLGHNAIFMAGCLVCSMLGTLPFQKLIFDGAVADAVLTFLLKLLLSMAVCSILLLIAAAMRSKSLGMVMAVVMGLTVTSILYGAINSGLGMLFKTTISIEPYMPDTVLDEARPDTVRALLVSAVTMGIFLPAAIRVFDTRDVK